MPFFIYLIFSSDLSLFLSINLSIYLFLFPSPFYIPSPFLDYPSLSLSYPAYSLTLLISYPNSLSLSYQLSLTHPLFSLSCTHFITLCPYIPLYLFSFFSLSYWSLHSIVFLSTLSSTFFSLTLAISSLFSFLLSLFSVLDSWKLFTMETFTTPILQHFF